MMQQIQLSSDARADAPAVDAARADATRAIASDLAYRRLAIVKVVFVGHPGAGDHGWVLIDAGIPGTEVLITGAAEARFGPGDRPSTIVMTYGHFDNVGALVDLAEEWDTEVYAHDLESPYFDGSAAYPPGDPRVGGGAMALLAPLYPTKPVDVAQRPRALPADGSVPPMPGQRWIHTPGHSPGYASFWREADGSLIVGDAFITLAGESAYATAVQASEIHGPRKYYTVDWDVARGSVERLAALQLERVESRREGRSATSHCSPETVQAAFGRFR